SRAGALAMSVPGTSSWNRTRSSKAPRRGCSAASRTVATPASRASGARAVWAPFSRRSLRSRYRPMSEANTTASGGEASIGNAGQPGRETTLQPEPGFGHVADDHLQLGLGDGGAHRRPLRVGDERAGDGADHVGALDRRAIAQAAFHQREQAVLGVDRARAAL